MSSQLLLSEACIALGEHLAVLLNNPGSASASNAASSTLSTAKNQRDIPTPQTQMTSSSKEQQKLSLRRDALNAFADAAGHAARAESYENAVHAARHYWNMCLPYLQQHQERAMLFENLREILQSLQVVYKFKPAEVAEDESAAAGASANDSDAKTDEKKDAEVVKGSKGNQVKGSKPGTALDKNKKNSEVKRSASKSPSKTEQSADASVLESQGGSGGEKPLHPLEDAFDDLTLRCVLYACLFQILIDKQEYEEALDQMELALADLPRTKHRLLIYRLKVITKAKLGLDVQMDLQKFREESEKNLAQMYRKVALSSIRHSDTISSYQRAIEALNVSFFKDLSFLEKILN